MFTRFVGLELKGRIISQGFTAQAVAQANGRSVSAFNRWLNGKVDIPLSVLCEACETIGIDPHEVVDTAYNRMVVALGERDGELYPAADAQAALDEAAALLAIGERHGLKAVSEADYTLAASDADIDTEVEAQQDEA